MDLVRRALEEARAAARGMGSAHSPHFHTLSLGTLRRPMQGRQKLRGQPSQASSVQFSALL